MNIVCISGRLAADPEIVEYGKGKNAGKIARIVVAVRDGLDEDGEPKGTAGTPILNVIQKSNQTNILIVIVRYFGGIKLGAGGLFRAYSNSASEIIKKTNES